MLTARARRVLFALLLPALGVGCATLATVPAQRATQGPTADQVYQTRFAGSHGRGPTFDETLAWKREFDDRVQAYVARHPELRTSPRLAALRVERRIAVGMSKDEVVLLAGPPLAVSSDPEAMRRAAAQFWPEVGRHAKEMWVYPGGWHLYFEDDRLVDLTVSGAPALE